MDTVVHTLELAPAAPPEWGSTVTEPPPMPAMPPAPVPPLEAEPDIPRDTGSG